MAAILVLDGLALLALAEAEVVVLRDAIDAIFGVLSHALSHSRLANLQNIRIGEAELSVAVVALALAKTEILRMCGKELLDRNEPLHCVSAIIGFHASEIARLGRPFHVFARVGTPLRNVPCHEVVTVAILDERRFGMVETRHLPLAICRYDRAFWGEPMDAEFAFEEGEDAIHRASRRASPYEEVFSDSPIGEVLVVLSGLSCACHICHALVVTHEDTAICGREVGRDGQLNAAHLLDVLLKFLRSRLF